MNREPPADDEDSYHESEDEDYNPDAANNSGSDAEDVDEEDKKLDSAYSKYQGSGGLIKTRAQRRAEAEGRKTATPKTDTVQVVGNSSIDVDELWKEMNGMANAEPARTEAVSTKNTASRDFPAQNSVAEEYITITRTFKFAGEVKTETKRVLKTSAEGQDYLREQKHAEEEAARKRSPELKESDENEKSADSAQVNKAADNLRSKGRGPVKRKMSLLEEYQMNKTKKINTLEKSRLDWLGFVDKEGIREDLTKHNKNGYLDKQGFLDRVDQKVDSDIRQQRAKRLN